MNDFTVPRRMSPGALFIIFLKTLKGVAGVFIIVGFVNIYKYGFDFSEPSGFLKILGIFAAAVIFSIFAALASYFPKKFYIKDGNLIFTHGILRRGTTTVPLTRIHSLRTRQGIFYRLFDMRGIAFDTIASRNEEIELILDEPDWQSLLALLKEGESPGMEDTITQERVATSEIRFKNKNLLTDALCQNHLKGVAVLAGFFAVIYDQLGYFTDDPAETIANYTAAHSEQFMLSPSGMFFVLIGAYLIVLLLWLGKVFLKYSDMSLIYDKTLLTFTYGLLARVSNRVSFSKVCAIWKKQNFFEKRLGLCTLRLQQALNATAEKEDDNLKLYGIDMSPFYLGWWLGEGYEASREITSSKSGRGLLMHMMLSPVLITVVSIVLLWYLELYIWIILPGIYFLFSLIKAFCALRRSRITLRERYLMIDSGGIAEIRSFIKYEDIEVVRIRCSPFTRWFHRVSLLLATSGTNHVVRSLREEEALRIYEILLSKAEA